MTESLLTFDRSFFLLINSFHSTWLDPVMVLFSGQGIWVPFIGYFFWHSYRFGGRNQTLFFALFLLLAIIASDVTSSYLLKNIFDRLRPCRELDLKPLIYSFGQKCGGKYGFVSSHAANSIALVLFSIRALNLKNRWIQLIWIVPFIVGYSRIYLGVHYPGDILGGALVGTFWGFAFSTFYRSAQGATR